MSTNPSPYTGTNVPTGTAGGVLAGTYPNPGLITGATTGTRYVGGTVAGAPITGTFVTADYVVDQGGLIWICTSGGSPGTWQMVNARTLRDQYTGLNGTLGETLIRSSQMNQGTTISSGTLRLTAVSLWEGATVGHISYCSASTAASGPTHWWFGLYDNNLNQLAVTADQGTNSWASNNYKSLAVATVASGAASSFTTTYTGLYYSGVMVAAGTVPTLVGTLHLNGSLLNQSPLWQGTSDTGLTTPPAFPHQGTAITVDNGNLTYSAILT